MTTWLTADSFRQRWDGIRGGAEGRGPRPDSFDNPL